MSTSKFALPRTLWIVGASVRSAVESALRAGYNVHAADLFADADLRQHLTEKIWPGQLLSCKTFHPFPSGLRTLETPPDCDAWLFTGGLENDPQLVEELCGRLPLLGASPTALHALRDPWKLHRLLVHHGFHSPETRDELPADSDPRDWLVKPIRSAGGVGATLFVRGTPLRPETYLQERVDGAVESATFLSHEHGITLVGQMRQYVAGDPSHPFLYRGSIGPLPEDVRLTETLMHLGNMLREASDLRGIFGVDYILKQSQPWVLEVNPRWTASCELFERATGHSLIDAHVRACLDRPENETVISSALTIVHGKWTVYANESLCPSPEFVAEALTTNLLDRSIADIPVAGETIRKGSPAFTLFGSGKDIASVERELRECESLLSNRLVTSATPATPHH